MMERTLSLADSSPARDTQAVPPGSLTTTGEYRAAVAVQAEAARRREAILRAVAVAATRFLGATASWEESIDDVLGQLGTATDASRVYMFRTFHDERGVLRADVCHEWVAPGVGTRIGDPVLHDLALDEAGLGRWETLARGETIHGSVSQLPEREQRFLAGRGVCSIVAVPVFVRDQWWGEIGRAHV